MWALLRRREMIVLRKARRAEETLSALEEYLASNGVRLIELVDKEVESWSEISYSELEEIIAAGRFDEYIKWREKYAALVNELVPDLLAAMTLASAKATQDKIKLTDSLDDVKAWIKTRGAEFVSELSEESKLAVRNIILLWQERLMRPEVMARQIRPLIGLTGRQMLAVDKYRAKVYNNYMELGSSAAQASARAEKAALRYSKRLHKQRAETIVHTELAFAYNQGADMGVRRAIRRGLMTECEMVWRTAGTNRVCGRCMALKDTVVGRTDEAGVQIPPLHPRCRCTIEYREL